MIKKVSIIFIMLLIVSTTIGFAEQYDFGGETVTIAYTRDIEYWFTDDPETEAWLYEVEDMFNVNIEFIGGTEVRPDDFIEYLTPQIMEGETEADVVMSRFQSTTNAAGNAGLIYPLDDFYPENFWEQTEKELKKEYFINPADGKNYGFPKDRLPPAGQILFYNKDLLEREGLPDPYELWQNDEWTWDVLLDIAQQVYGDTTGDGEIDRWGITSGWSMPNRFTEWDLASWLVSNNVDLLHVENGRVKSNLNSAEVIETLEYLQELYGEYGVTRGKRRDLLDWKRDYNMFKDGEVAFMLCRPLRISAIADMEDHFRLVPLPKGPRGTEYQVARTDVITLTIPVTVDTDKVTPLIDLFTTLWRTVEPHWELEKDEYIEQRRSEDVKRMRCEEGIETLHWIQRNNIVWNQQNDYLMRPIWPDYEDLQTRILEDGEDPSTVVAALDELVQTHLDDLLGQ